LKDEGETGSVKKEGRKRGVGEHTTEMIQSRVPTVLCEYKRREILKEPWIDKGEPLNLDRLSLLRGRCKTTGGGRKA